MNFLLRYRRLAPLVCFSIALNIIRILYTGNIGFAFLAWNLFLALLPLYFSHRLDNSRSAGLAPYGWAALWLLFFPNAAYIVTDLFHLRERPPVPQWFDLVLLFSTALNGLIAGFLSLYQVEQWLSRRFSKAIVHLCLVFIMLLNGFGIYMGRYLRWNSWDLLVHPFRMSRNLSEHVIYPGLHLQGWGLTLLFACWMYLFYFSFRKWKSI